MNNKTNIYILGGIALMVIILFILFPIEEEKIDSALGNLIKISGIIAAFITAYLGNKMSFIRSKKEEIKKQIIEISFKLTEFRRILYFILTDHGFWEDGVAIKAFKKSYPKYDYHELHKDNPINWLQSYFWSREKRYSQTKIDLYLGIEAIVHDTKNKKNWVFDDTVEPIYPIDYLEYIDLPSRVLYYYFDHKWHKYLKGKVNIDAIDPTNILSPISTHAANIDNKYQDMAYDRFFLADLGTEFNYKYIPRLHALTAYNNGGIPNYVKGIIHLLIVFLVFGVVFPLIIQSTSLSFKFDRFLGTLSIVASILGICWILLNFSNIFRKEIIDEYSN